MHQKIHRFPADEERPDRIAVYMLENNTTVRAAARRFGVSKSTVYCDVANRLRKRDKALFEQVRALLERNKKERHLRGGEATKEKYRRKREHNNP